ncbi:Asparagine synthase [Marivirga sericea]|uniref:asparagine synthase (glutamine-hydrolyzing) n=1 Tax=Marivirga sericea TaxID=1028 RepID=A0A1X7KLE9_9BACT|nr:asparagine synthase-related protein [Marivirga sericea]SMG42263.1 Asparagine synthase [Marivirga sericea]
MSEIEKTILELNLLGSSINIDDPFRKQFLDTYEANLLEKFDAFETEKEIDFVKLEKVLTEAILPKIKNKVPVVFLSGGIDSTVIAHVLYKNNIPFQACSFFDSEEDPSIAYVEYLEKKYNIVSEKYFLDYDKLRANYQQYFTHYQSPNLDYAFLSMCSLVNDFCGKSNSNGDLIFLDGIEGDNLFGYKNNSKLFFQSFIRGVTSYQLSNSKIYDNRRLNIYSSSLIDDYSLNSLYQNFIFPKLLTKKQAAVAKTDLNNRLIEIAPNLSFHSKNMLGMLYYMGRRVAYKNFLPIKNFGNEVLYPFIDKEVLKFGFRLDNKIKIKPVIKYPLKAFLEKEGYSKWFVFSEKRGMGFDIFNVISFDDIEQGLKNISQHFDLKEYTTCHNYLYNLYSKRDKAVDHFLFGIAMSSKYLEHHYG